MKIEMAESLGASWLKHVKRCQIVQTNWKVSQFWQKSCEWQRIEDILEDVRNCFFDNREPEKRLDILKKNTAAQFIHQTECDVIGWSSSRESSKYYSLEMAFHGNQLNYGSKNVTIAKVISKLLKSALCFYCYFCIDNAEVGFASPKIGASIFNDLYAEIGNLQDLFNKHGFHFDFKLYANLSFKTEIMDPVLNLRDEIADTAELFLRSIQLHYLVNEAVEPEVQQNDEEINGLPKVAQLVREALVPILQRDDFPQEEINDFMDLQYSKDIFKINFPLLAAKREPIQRYYVDPITLHGKNYFLCSQWYERNRGPLVEWIERYRDYKD